MTGDFMGTKRNWAPAALALAFFLVLTASARAQLSLGGDSPVKLESDRVEYLREEGVVVAEGHVHAQQEGVHIYADKLRYELDSQQLTAEGEVTWQQDNQEVRCSRLDYNLGTKKGSAVDVISSTAPWHFRGRDVLFQENKVQLNEARFTTCDYPDGYEHYHMRASRITIRPGRTLVARNVVLFMGKFPVFYLPFFAKNLRDFRMPFQFDTGNSAYLGRYALFTINYLLSPVNYGSAYIDFFQKKGVGLGLRHEIELNEYSVLSLYGYHVREKDTKVSRWEGRARGLWALSSRLQGRVEIEAPGDGLFSQNYSAARRDASLVSTQRQYDLSGNWNTKTFNLGLLFRRLETATYEDEKMDHYLRTSQSAPQAEFSLRPVAVMGRSGPKFDLSTNITRRWLQTNDFFQTQGSVGMGLAQSWTPVKAHTFYARLGTTDTFLDKSDVGASNRGNSRYLNTTANLTSRWLPMMTTTFSHAYNRKLIHLLDEDRPLHGVTQNSLNGSLQCHFGTFLTSRTSTSYDFLHSNIAMGKKFSFLRQEVTCTPSRWVDYLVVANYSIVAKEMKDLSQVVSFKSPKDMWRYRFTLNHMNPDVTTQGMVVSGVEKTLDMTVDLSVVLFTNYRLSLLEQYDLEKSSFVSRRVGIYRDLHDWEAEFGYSQSVSQDKRVYFKLNLKAFPGRPLTVSDSEMKRWSGYREKSLGELGETAAQDFR